MTDESIFNEDLSLTLQLIKGNSLAFREAQEISYSFLL